MQKRKRRSSCQISRREARLDDARPVTPRRAAPPPRWFETARRAATAPRDAVGDTAEVVFLGAHLRRDQAHVPWERFVQVRGGARRALAPREGRRQRRDAGGGDGRRRASPWGHPFQLSSTPRALQVRHTRAPKMGAHAPHAGRRAAPRPTNGPLVARCFFLGVFVFVFVSPRPA